MNRPCNSHDGGNLGNRYSDRENFGQRESTGLKPVLLCAQLDNTPQSQRDLLSLTTQVVGNTVQDTDAPAFWPHLAQIVDDDDIEHTI